MDKVNQDIRMLIGNLTVENIGMKNQIDDMRAHIDNLTKQLAAKTVDPQLPETAVSST